MSSRGAIVIIDDDERLLARLRALLEQAGYSVTATSQTVGAARHLARCDLVILDFHMPGLDGAAVLASLRAAVASAPEPPLFYLYTSDTAASQSWQATGFDGVFTFKGDDERLVLQVHAALRARRLMARRPR